MSMRLWPVLACLPAFFALPAAASAHVHHGQHGYDEEQYYPGDEVQPAQDPGTGGYDGESWPGAEPAPPVVGATPGMPVVPVVPAKPSAPVVPPAPVAPVTPALPTVPASRGTVSGKVAMLRTDGKAAIPRGAPKAVRTAIAAANQIIGKPYKWGGGHAKLVDSGYDCSGAVSYSLIGAR